MSMWRIVASELRVAAPASSLCRSSEPDLGGDGGQGIHDERDVRVQIHPELDGSAVDVVAIDRAREGFVLQLFLHRPGFHPGDDLAGAHERAGVDEPGQLVAGVQRSVEQASAWHARVVGVGEDRIHDRFRNASGVQDLRAFHRMLWRPRVHLVVEVMEHAGDAPLFGVFTVPPGVRAHRRLDRPGVLAEAVALGELGQDRPGRRAVHYVRVTCFCVRHLSMDFLEKTKLPLISIQGIPRWTASWVSAASSMARYVEASRTLITSFGVTGPPPLWPPCATPRPRLRAGAGVR